MDFSIKAFDWSKTGTPSLLAAKSDCVVIGVFEGQTLSGASRQLDTLSKGRVARLIKSGDMTGKNGSTFVLHDVEGIGAARVLLVGLGKQDKFDVKAFTDATRAAWRALSQTRAANATWALTQTPVNGRGADWAVRVTVTTGRELAYRYTETKSKAEPDERVLKKVTLIVDPADEKAAKLALKQGVAIANGADLTRELGNLPPNICTPTYLGQTARKLAKDFKLKVEVLGQKQIEALKMGAFLSVARASSEPPQFIVLQYHGAATKQAPVVLVGKGITFDTGGISLKPGASMDEMKYDMCGAGSVLGTIAAVAEMGLKLNVIGVIPTCENMPGGNAVKPGDIVTSMSGQTIEVLNTDAEGRLILCDALTYVERFKPAAVIDIATLTGACVVALGHHNSGLFTKDDALAEHLLAASKTSGDAAWRMPLEDAYQEQLKSNFADVANIGSPGAGAVVAACFLARFTEAYPWAHLDIAGTAWKGGAAKGATGRPVPLLSQYLIDRAD
ncbi:leucyl aminopeptidase [Pararobbsia silviterrae]|uniref:Probable cytosol aminopeptidase n=1 Tax=Pararobbsia silviterrae TaxID=1792498 RepID=A0A494Y8S7_9BURK|nr:leucyl aminopeptidase [Pararobbsia silviterrae]RKP56706.1 leucyl aminopeptidase [Pararobbsia silviterrae]